MATKKLTHSELEKLLETSDFSVGQERNDFLLPQIVDFVKRDHWINIRPEYQRRLVWDVKKKSRLIESLFMNVPIPPIFLYEHDLNRYEVMDGQQRLNTILDFYENKFSLRGLDYWSGLNGYKYAKLPPRAQRGLDRRRVTATVLISEKGSSQSAMIELRRQVFDRLNTGGQKLNAQELRNCLYAGAFNDLIGKLAGDPVFDDLWGIPRYEDNIRGENITDELAKNSLYKRMIDVEIVLRYFAFSGSRSKIKGSVKKILDSCMQENVNLAPERCADLEKEFKRDVRLARDIFGVNAFQLPGTDSRSQPYFDAIMVSFSRLSGKHAALRSQALSLRKVVRKVVTKDDESKALFVGRANTSSALKERLDRMEKAFESVL